MMKSIGTDLHRASGAFKLSSMEDSSILDFCAAPGGFLQTALCLNPRARAVGFSLPIHDSGHALLLPKRLAFTVKFLDLTMLAADMGMQELPQNHPDVRNFLPRELQSEMVFDLVICDGQVLRTQHLPSYRKGLEARRLAVTQLALGLEHMRPGGTMVVLLHKVEAWETILTLRLFSEISTMVLFKPDKYHAKRSSFYLVAKNIATEHPMAHRAIDEWKRMWTLATFGPQEELDDLIRRRKGTLPGVLEEFGPELIQHGEPIWTVQANALSKADFIRHNSAAP